MEGYYKWMRDLIDYDEGYNYISGVRSGWENAVATDGRGWTYGAELLWRKHRGRLRGWLGYTLSWNWRRFEDINEGMRYPFRYDRRHDLNLTAMFSLRPGIQLSGSWVYSTGQAITLATGRHESFFQDRLSYPMPHDPLSLDVAGDIRLYEAGRNNFRMRAYHRLDLGVSFVKEKAWGSRTWRLGLYNAYNRRNPFYYELRQRYEPSQGRIGELYLVQISLFTILPSVSYGVAF